MMPPTLTRLRSLLVAEGLPVGEPSDWRERIGTEEGAPWFVRILVGFGAWVAGILLAVGFSVMFFSGSAKGTALVVLGPLFCAGAGWLRREARADFPIQLALSLSLAGQVMTGVGLAGVGDSHGGGSLVFAGLLVLEGVLFLVFPDRVHRFLSALATALLLTLLLDHWHLGHLDSAMMGLPLLAWALLPPPFWKGEPAKFHRPAGYAFGTVFLGVYVRTTVAGAFLHHDLRGSWATSFSLFSGPLLGALAPSLLLGALGFRVAQRLGLVLTQGRGMLLVAVWVGLALLGLRAPGIPAMLFVLMLAIEVREPVLSGMAVLSGLFFLSQFYYDLGLTLLAKSGLLVGSGALLLALRLALGRKESQC